MVFKKAPPPERVQVAADFVEKHASSMSCYHLVSLLYRAGYSTKEINEAIGLYMRANTFDTQFGTP